MILDDNLITEVPEADVVLSDKEIFTKIWTSPRMVFRFIEQRAYGKYVPILLVLTGISSAIDNAANSGSGDSMSLWVVIAMVVVFGGLLGWISYYIYAALLNWTGKWLKGKGNTKSILRVLAYASIPTVAALIIVFAKIGVFGVALFQSYFTVGTMEMPMQVFYFVTVFLEAMLGIWTFVLMVVGISEIQRLSIGKSILNLLLPIFIIIIPIALIAFILGDIFA